MRFGVRPVLAGIMAAILLLTAAISVRSLSRSDASATALPDACRNLAVVAADPSALADESFTLGIPHEDAVARLQEACQRTSGL